MHRSWDRRSLVLGMTVTLQRRKRVLLCIPTAKGNETSTSDGWYQKTNSSHECRRHVAKDGVGTLEQVGGGRLPNTRLLRLHLILEQADLTTNPFDDASMVGGDDRRVSSATAITEPGSIRDSEVYAGVIQTVYAFPAPPDPTRRPSIS